MFLQCVPTEKVVLCWGIRPQHFRHLSLPVSSAEGGKSATRRREQQREDAGCGGRGYDFGVADPLCYWGRGQEVWGLALDAIQGAQEPFLWTGHPMSSTCSVPEATGEGFRNAYQGLILPRQLRQFAHILMRAVVCTACLTSACFLQTRRCSLQTPAFISVL